MTDDATTDAAPEAPDPAPKAADETRRIRVLLADDQHVVRAGFALVLARDPRLEVVAEASDGQEAVDLARLHVPDVVLMDVRMPRLDGIEATRRLCGDPALAGLRVLVLTTYELDEYIVDAIHAGASGFLLKDVEPDELRRAVRLVAGGESLLSPRVTARVLATVREQTRRPTVSPDRLATLTDREREVVALVGRGCTNAEIGRELFMSPATAKTHVSRAMTKLHARDRVQLAILAHRTGLADP